MKRILPAMAEICFLGGLPPPPFSCKSSFYSLRSHRDSVSYTNHKPQQTLEPQEPRRSITVLIQNACAILQDIMELVERTDRRFEHLPLYRHADCWRHLFDRASGRALDNGCFVSRDENGYTGTIFAYSEPELVAFVEKEFRRFKVSSIQPEDGVYIAHVEPRVLGWKLLN